MSSEKVKTLEKMLAEEKAKETRVVFYSPGTFCSETSSKECKLGDIKTVLKFMKSIKERHGATPYGFRFENGNGKILGGYYFVTGTIKMYCEIPDNKENDILRFNMRCNGYPIIIENNNSYKFTYFFEPEDTIIDWEGNIIRKGNDADLVHYRKEFKKQKD